MKLLLVEDDSMIGESLSRALGKNGYAINWVTDGEAAETALSTCDYDLVILDLGLPKRTGMDILSDMRRKKNTTPVLILTAQDSVTDRVKGLDTGADDYVSKPFALEELEARIRRLLRREAGEASPILHYGGVTLDPATHEVWLKDTKVVLTSREFSLLMTMMRTPGAVFSRARLEESIYGWNEEVGSNAVEVHIHQIRKKLGKNMIRTMRNVGYTLAGTDEVD